MSSRDRDTKSFQDKLKVFFKKGGTAPVAARNELLVGPELERELSPETPLARRLRAIREVGEKALQIRIQEGGVEKIWSCTRDLLEESNVESRHAALCLLRRLAEGQDEQLLVMRTTLFHFLRVTHAAAAPEDGPLRFRLLHTLTNSGKNINCFEEQIGAFLLEWLAQLQQPAQIIEFLQLIINVVKFNATYLDEDIVHGIVNHACYLCVYPAEGGVVHACLSLLEAVLSYSLLPRSALPAFVAALCRTVNLDQYCQTSWKLMRCVVGADIGHAALQELVHILRSSGEGGDGCAVDAGLVRGAVFYINMALWGPKKVHNIKVSFLAVLPAFLKALSGAQAAAVVVYEVVVALQSLVARVPHELHEPAAHVLLQAVRRLLHHDKVMDPPNELIHSRVHALISSLEALQEAGQYRGPPGDLLDLLDHCAHDRPEASAMKVVTARAAQLTGEAAGAALALADRYLRCEPRLPVRLHTLAALLAYIRRHRCGHGEELAERVGTALAAACALDAEAALRAAAARALPELARMCAPDACTDLIDLLEKILNRPFEMYVTDVPIPAEADTSDLRLAAGGLLEVLQEQALRSPGALATRALLVLLDHLDHHYRRPALFVHHPDIRLKIFDMLFGLRVNAFNCVGFCYEASGAVVWGAAAAGPGALRLQPLCSPFLLAEPPAVRGQQPQPLQPKDLPAGACVFPAGRTARALTTALSKESEWAVLAHVLRALPGLLQARALLVGRRAHDLDLLASTLCAMVSERSPAFAEGVRAGGGQKLSQSELHATALPALAALASYHSFLEPHTQQRIIRCLLRYGMVLRQAQPYINALTIFTLETRETMGKMLPEVLLDLSKISDTQAIASPMLEFLSTLTRLPRVFASFVEDQYMSVFAILLPYTNPSRYNRYVVSLAHHVIAAWFLKCRLSYRRNFVRFIIHGLHNYIILPCEEQLHYKTNNFQQTSANEDSSNRQRSSSLGSKAVSRAPLAGSRAPAVPAAPAAPAAFHVELTETCIDLLARYTFTPCAVKPQRSDMAEFLFNGGQSTTWLVGHKLVTITTSGCLQNSIKQGLCERCALLCRHQAESAPAPPPAPPPAPADTPHTPHTLQVQASDNSDLSQPSSGNHLNVHNNPHPHPPEVKRYSKHSLQHSRSTETSCSSLSISEALQPPTAPASRQNSAENNKSNDSILEALNQFSQRFEKSSKEMERETGEWASRAGELAAAGACPCWCGGWAELHVRSPTGDVSWLLRLQNQMSWSQLQEWPLQDVLALLTPPAAAGPLDDLLDHAPHTNNTHAPTVGAETRARGEPRPAPAPAAADLHKSSSDSVVAGERRAPLAAPLAAPPAAPLGPQPARMSTQPINIPGSPQRQSSSSTTDDDDLLLVLPESKSRHPVRRSNSSPEMSSSWKLSARDEDDLGPDADADDANHMIVLPRCEPATAAMTLHATKKAAKKSDMRVSCEAIPEEISGTSPLAQPPQHAQPSQHVQQPQRALAHVDADAQAHGNAKAHVHAAYPHLMTLNSDPGTEVGNGGDVGAHHQLQKTASDGTVPEGRGRRQQGPGAAPRAAALAAYASGALERDELPPLSRSKRSNTISVMSPTRRHREAGWQRTTSGGVAPSFVFLQLYHNMSTHPISPPVPGEAAAALNPLTERPLKVSGVQHERTIKNLDLVPPLETYKIGVLYVGPGQQDNEVAILRNEYGSVRYAEFLRQLGTLVPLEGCDEPTLFLNLEKGGKDGRYAYVWHDDIMQVLFHVATAMPSCAKDPSCNEKRKYIGNDYVSIVYNHSGADFNILTIKGQLNFCIVLVEPMEHGMNRVFVKTKDERLRNEFLAHMDAHAVSDANVALLARQLAVHCALASLISQSLKMGAAPFASNSLERLRLIKRLRRRLEAERLAAAASAPAPYAAAPDSVYCVKEKERDDDMYSRGALAHYWTMFS
ncbi:PREDICTED: tuberin [Papilio xuthus]|uniref:Tuberin n=1 Tax=Papilio xuthus TaxID=66420 RepID=A0AAJ6ZBI4_PAPXU|nr:PREDICTED: tuberin [Papilio xuthus]